MKWWEFWGLGLVFLGGLVSDCTHDQRLKEIERKLEAVERCKP